MSVKFILLGSGAVRPNPRRQGPSQVLLVGDDALMFDCGPGATRQLVKAGVPAERLDKLFLTHLHFDHTLDFPYLLLVGWNNGRDRKLRVFGPYGTRTLVERAVRPPFEFDISTRLGHGKDPFGLDPEVTDVMSEGTVLDENGVRVSCIYTQHAGMPTFVYGVEAEGKKVVITGDTNPSEKLTQFCRGADLLVCECSGTREFLSQYPWGKWHMTPETVSELARGAGVGRLVLKHFVIEDITGDTEAAERMSAEVRNACSCEVAAGCDGLEVEL